MTATQVTREIADELDADIAKFETVLAEYLAGEVEEDVFRIFRLNNGIYGQRQGGQAHHEPVSNISVRCPPGVGDYL